MSNELAGTKPRGSRTDGQMGSTLVSLAGRDLRVLSGTQQFKPVKLFVLILLLQQQRLTAATGMTFQQTVGCCRGQICKL